ncbi:lytic transglycosylase domain-containing protein [Chitinibacter tainanensis]|uniref:lytic transglycosylase domain-containing protein n=1 Tax=Chitinibacter tainanensis TaxID=230667 RepID=UPI002357E2CB|nr:transglycosylase SLT domain-containing protein [Chitinibacter tainanensis]
MREKSKCGVSGRSARVGLTTLVLLAGLSGVALAAPAVRGNSASAQAIPAASPLPALTQQEAADPWQAALQYCRAARQGELEAQYRLGMLYAFGLGVPADRTAAASLFAVAAAQGHQQAQDMLETVAFRGEQLPPCVLADVAPAKAPVVPVPASQVALSQAQKKTARIISQLARWYGVDPDFALSIALVESQLRPDAISPKQAMGVMQLIPDTAERFQVQDVFNVSQNVKGGIRYLRVLLDRYQGRIDLVSAAYNAGEGTVDRYRGVPPYPETRQYVNKIQRLYPPAIHRPDQYRYSASAKLKRWQ